MVISREFTVPRTDIREKIEKELKILYQFFDWETPLERLFWDPWRHSLSQRMIVILPEDSSLSPEFFQAIYMYFGGEAYL